MQCVVRWAVTTNEGLCIVLMVITKSADTPEHVITNILITDRCSCINFSSSECQR